MQVRKVELTVGLFMLAGLLALLFMAIKVSGLSLQPRSASYQLYAYFDNIGALRPKARVALAGVTIGHVTAIELDAERYMAKVTLAIDESVNTIPVDSTAAIMTSGLLGEQFIHLSIGGEADYLQKDNIIEDTQSALVLEELIGKFLLNAAKPS